MSYSGVLKFIYMIHIYIYIYTFDRDRQRQTDAVAAAALRSSFPITNLSLHLFVMATTQYMWLIEMNGQWWKEMEAWEQNILEKSIADGNDVVEYVWAYTSGSTTRHIKYRWDLLTMLQTNLDTSYQRKLLRIEKPGTPSQGSIQ